MNPLLEIKRLGQSVWLDNLSRPLLRDGGLRRLIEQDGLTGVTSNPAIFQKAIAADTYYRDDLARLKTTTLDPEQRYESLAIADVQAACDLLSPIYETTRGDDGYVSLEVSPTLAHDETATVDTARRLYRAVNRRNVLIKVPATPAGVRAFGRLIADGISINVTLLFSLWHVLQVVQAYIRGMRARIDNGGDPRTIKAVASLFVSRVDTLVDKQLETLGSAEALSLRGRTGVAIAKLAYQRYKELFHGPAFVELAARGTRPQYLLWGSTGTKNPAYSDVLYVEPLIGPETINTMPDATLAAFRDHGQARLTLEQGVEEAEAHFLALERIGIDLHVVGETLQVDGVRLFDEAYSKLLELTQ
ncbi:MAG: transaldolase [Gammaproteobacteria bacterium]|nr:transaldolase [Gammaproteobacteria bacterium]